MFRIPSYGEIFSTGFSGPSWFFFDAVPEIFLWGLYVLCVLLFLGTHIVVSYHLNRYSVGRAGALRGKITYSLVSIIILLAMFAILIAFFS